LTDQQYALLDFLNLKDGAIVSRVALLDHLYIGADRPEPKIIDVLVCILRKKLAAVSDGKKFIETVRGAGYRLAMPQAS
jgi:two-component system cell cycle response regulator CtrA